MQSIIFANSPKNTIELFVRRKSHQKSMYFETDYRCCCYKIKSKKLLMWFYCNRHKNFVKKNHIKKQSYNYLLDVDVKYSCLYGIIPFLFIIVNVK